MRPWSWAERPAPEPFIKATRYPEEFVDAEHVATVGQVGVFRLPQNEYAYVETATEHVPCVAHAIGGNIDVTCTTTAPGQLIVQENAWTGWSAGLDGVSVPLIRQRWLSVAAPAGLHQYAFRYRPVDVILGLALTGIGTILAGWLWVGTVRAAKLARTKTDVK